MKLLKHISILLLIITVLISCFVIVINKDKIPVRYLVIKSGSMQPILNIGDIIIIKKQNDYEIGDIITYNFNDEYFVTHRIIEKIDKDFITKGDNNTCEDEEHVKLENIEGKVINIINSKAKNIALIFINILIIYILWKGNKNEKNN